MGQSSCLRRLRLRRAKSGETSKTPRLALTTTKLGEAPDYGWTELTTSPFWRTMAHSVQGERKRGAAQGRASDPRSGLPQKHPCTSSRVRMRSAWLAGEPEDVL